MSLDWNLTKIKERHALHNTGDDAFPEGSPEDIEGNKQWAITQGIIWNMLGAGIGSITEKNWQQVATRIIAYEQVIGTMLVDHPISVEEVKRRIGLSTNISTITPASFKKKLGDKIVERAERETKLQVKNIEGIPA